MNSLCPKRSDTQTKEDRQTATTRTIDVYGGGDLASAKQLVNSADCSFDSCAEHGHKDSVQRPNCLA